MGDDKLEWITAAKKYEKFQERCPKLLSVGELTVIDRVPDGRLHRWTYDYHRSGNDLGFYIAPINKYAGTRFDGWTNEFLILPNTVDELRRRFSSHIGFMFTTIIEKQETVQFLDRHDLANITVQFGMVIRRFNYRLKGHDNIVIDRIHDPLIPPKSYTFSCPASQLELTQAEAYVSLIMEYGLHFAISDI